MNAPQSEDDLTAKARALGLELAYPCLPPVDPNGGGSAGGYPYPEMGMRKREAFAKAALQGVIAIDGIALSYEEAAAQAVKFADALLKELAK